MTKIKEQIFALASKRKVKIGIGLLKVDDSILNSLKRGSKYAQIVTIGTKVRGFENIKADRQNIEQKEVEALLKGKVKGLIRGQADTYRFEDRLAKEAGHKRSDILSGSLVIDQFGREFFTTSGSHSDGWTVKSKMLMTDGLIKLAKDFKVRPKIGFLTWVRPGSVGRNFFFDNTWEQAEYLVNYYLKRGYQAKNYNIEIETALDDGANIIVFATGPSGNIFHRALQFLTKNPTAIYFHLGIKEKIIENNRTVSDYFNFIVACAAMVNKK